MKLQFWGTRGSIAAPGPETTVYGGNTSCVQVTGDEGGVLVLDAGTGLLRLGAALPRDLKRVDVLLTHLHMDHIQGLGFFSALYNPGMTVHVWGPASTTLSLRSRLVRYLSKPLFPVAFRDLPCTIELHHVPCNTFEIGEFLISTWLVCHPGPTVGYRIVSRGKVISYLPDHEPALGMNAWAASDDWISGFDCAHLSDVLIHDAQYTEAEYAQRIGWGHSHLKDALTFAARTEAKKLFTFHHDPGRSDADLEAVTSAAVRESKTKVEVAIAREGEEIEV